MLKKESNSTLKTEIGMHHGDYTLTSAFQPIISLPHRRVVGLEALVRATDDSGNSCSPLELFSLPDSTLEHLRLDRVCRQVHLKNFSRQDTDNEWLFINLDSESLSIEKPDPGFMDKLFSISGVPAHRVVIEILESKISDKGYIKYIVDHFRKMGCLIAIDDFGAGHSNFDRIWELSPDIVKLDCSLIFRAAQEPKIKRILTGMVSLIHEAGSLVIIEGIETQKEALVAIESHADMVQGFYFSMPDARIKQDEQLAKKIDDLINMSQSQRQQESDILNNSLEELQNLFKQSIVHFQKKEVLSEAVAPIFNISGVVRCFLLDEFGYQIGRNIHSIKYQENIKLQFAPLIQGGQEQQANWSHMHYHHRALAQPNKLNITRPYLSIAGAETCITVSQLVVIKNKKFVLCCDLAWGES